MKLCLMLHGLGTPPTHLSVDEKRYWIDEDRFAQILACTKRAGPRVEITFDDGNASDLDIALPALQKAGLAASFFVIAGNIGQAGHLDEDGIRTLRDGGMRIGSHGTRHIPWTSLSDAEVRADLDEAERRLRDILGASIDSVAVPFGECDVRVARILRRAGIARVYTSFHGPTLASDWLIRRECVTADLPMATIEDWMLRRYHAGDVVYSFLRAAKHVRHAALWRIQDKA